MSADDPFRESRQGHDSLRRLYTDCSSLNAHTIGIAPRACDSALRTLYTIATGEPFPHEHFYPWHDPLGLARKLGIADRYSARTQAFAGRMQGWALPEVEYGGQPFQNHTSPKAKDRAGEVVNGVGRFIDETAAFQNDDEVLTIIRTHKP